MDNNATKLFLSSILLVFNSFFLFAQQTKPKKYALENQFKMTYAIVGLDFSYEFGLNETILSEVGLGIGAGSYVVEESFVNSKESGLSLSFEKFLPIRLKSRTRYFYNRKKRLERNKNNNNNAGNYIGLQFVFNTSQNTEDIINPPHNTLLSDVHWGLQRSLGGQWIFNFYIGLGYLKDFDTKLGKVVPAMGLEFGYIFF